MGKENIEKYSGKELIRKIICFWHNNVYYRKVIVSGRENFNPDDHPFCTNHEC